MDRPIYITCSVICVWRDNVYPPTSPAHMLFFHLLVIGQTIHCTLFSFCSGSLLYIYGRCIKDLYRLDFKDST